MKELKETIGTLVTVFVCINVLAYISTGMVNGRPFEQELEFSGFRIVWAIAQVAAAIIVCLWLLLVISDIVDPPKEKEA